MSSINQPKRLSGRRPAQRCQGLDRRQYLRATGVSLALPFFPSLMAGRAWGSTATGVETGSHPRMVCLGTSLGMYAEEWTPKDSGKDFRVPRLLKPLEGLRDDFTVFSNLDHPNVKGGHKGVPAFLSGVYRLEQIGSALVVRNSVTMDQFAASQLTGETRFASMQLSAGAPNGFDLLSWSPKGISLPAQHDPLAIYSALFTDDANPQRTAELMNRGKSVLDLVNRDAKAFANELSTTDRNTLDQYMTSVRDTEKGIAQQLKWVATPKPRAPKVEERPTTYHENLDLLLELVALALQTDSTRVISLMVTQGGLPIDIGTKRIAGHYHAQSHHGKDPKVIEELVAIERGHMVSLKKFLSRLKAIPTDKGSLLDCTQVLFGSGMGNGSAHSNRDLPILLAGGGFSHQGHVRSAEGTPLCNLFVSMLHRMNLSVDAFSDSNGNFNEVLGLS